MDPKIEIRHRRPRAGRVALAVAAAGCTSVRGVKNFHLTSLLEFMGRVIRKSGHRFSVRSRAKLKILITFITSDRSDLT
jgi:hypothetical protein